MFNVGLFVMQDLTAAITPRAGLPNASTTASTDEPAATPFSEQLTAAVGQPDVPPAIATPDFVPQTAEDRPTLTARSATVFVPPTPPAPVSDDAAVPSTGDITTDTEVPDPKPGQPPALPQQAADPTGNTARPQDVPQPAPPVSPVVVAPSPAPSRPERPVVVRERSPSDDDDDATGVEEGQKTVLATPLTEPPPITPTPGPFPRTEPGPEQDASSDHTPGRLTRTGQAPVPSVDARDVTLAPNGASSAAERHVAGTSRTDAATALPDSPTQPSGPAGFAIHLASPYPAASAQHATPTSTFTETAPPASRITDQVAPAVVALGRTADGAQHVTVRLEPVDLGRVEVRIERISDEPTRVRVTVERAETMELLQRDQPRLEHALDRAGVMTEGRQITFHLGPIDASAPQATDVGRGSTSSPTYGTGPDGSPRDDNAQQSAVRHGRRFAGPDPADPESESLSTPDMPVSRWIRAGIDITA